jgi:hypothetical protein
MSFSSGLIRPVSVSAPLSTLSCIMDPIREYITMGMEDARPWTLYRVLGSPTHESWNSFDADIRSHREQSLCTSYETSVPILKVVRRTEHRWSSSTSVYRVVSQVGLACFKFRSGRIATVVVDKHLLSFYLAKHGE